MFITYNDNGEHLFTGILSPGDISGVKLEIITSELNFTKDDSVGTTSCQQVFYSMQHLLCNFISGNFTMFVL